MLQLFSLLPNTLESTFKIFNTSAVTAEYSYLHLRQRRYHQPIRRIESGHRPRVDTTRLVSFR
jgi:hypothetical protein